jgi:hypothetical protein
MLQYLQPNCKNKNRQQDYHSKEKANVPSLEESKDWESSSQQEDFVGCMR